jgi:hypothetical protein
MPNRTAKTYDTVFEFISEKLGSFQPVSIMSDFEVASRKSFSSFFPETIQKGCYFHFMQCVWRHIQGNSDILNVYKSDSYFAFHLRYLVSLAFMPEMDVIGKYEEILEMEFFNAHKELLKPFINYFEETWIGVKRRGRRLSPLFSISLWNVREAVLNEQDKTNNSSEGFNSALASLMSCHHPNIWKFIIELNKMQCQTEVSIAMTIFYLFTCYIVISES